MGDGGVSMVYLAAVLIVLYIAGASIYALSVKIRERIRRRRDDG